MMDIPVPWLKFLGQAPTNMKLPALRIGQVLNLIYDCYEKKLAADAVDDKVCSHYVQR